MCLLTFLPENVDFDYERARVSAQSNPDGFGFAIHAGVAIVKDHDMDFEKLWLRWIDLRKTYRGPALFHFRITTHGDTNIGNCHPFDVDGKPNTVLAHNGILPLTMPLNDNRSDTKLFAELVLPAIGGVEALDNRERLEELENWAIGNKLVVLTVDEKAKFDWYIINEKLGHWDFGMWWSNSSYKRTYATNYINYGYTSPYLGSTKSTYQNGIYDDYDDDIGAWGDSWNKSISSQKTKDDSGWTFDDTIDYVQDELYPNSDIMEKIVVFTDYSNPEFATVNCWNCGATYYVDALEPSATHCGECRKCLHCSDTKCNCWDNYEYGQSFICFDKEDGELSRETKVK